MYSIKKTTPLTINLLFLLIIYATFADAPIAIDNINNLQYAMFQETEIFQEESEGLPWYKAVKDLLLILSVLLVLVRAALQPSSIEGNKLINTRYKFLLSGIAIAFTIGLVNYGLIVGLVGLRSYWSVLAFLLGFAITEFTLLRLTHLVGILLIIQAIVSIIQQFIGYNFLYVSWGYRSTGTFFNPNALALFAVAGAALLCIQERTRYWYVYAASAWLIVIVSGSRTGFVALFICSTIYVFYEIRAKTLRGILLVMGLPLMLAIIYLAEAVAARGSLSGELALDEKTRIGIFLKYLADASIGEILFGSGLGIGSNILYTLTMSPVQSGASRNLDLTFITDSMITASFVQGGFILFISFLLFALAPIGQLRRPTRLRRLTIVLPTLLLIGGISNIVWEVAPFNYIIFALYGWVAKISINSNSTLPLSVRLK